MSAPRVGIIGARRHRQGLGPHVARYLRTWGAEVPCFVGTSARTIDLAREELARTGIEARGYLDAGEMIARERLDAIAILSPPETHASCLDLALSGGLHALCEKPLVWGGEGNAAEALRIAEGFRSRGLLLRENCQWPYTLGAYAELHPGVLDAPAQHFEMRLSPTAAGKAMIPDAMPHALSLLQALADGPEPRIEGLRFSTHRLDAPGITIGFRYVAGDRSVDASIELVQEKAQPREAGYAVNGRWARRMIRVEDYAMFFASGARVVDVPDPLALLVGSFVRALEAAPREASAAREIAERARLLDEIANAFEGGRR